MGFLGSWDFSMSVGEVTEVRQMSETHVSGGGSDSSGNIRSIKSSTTHFNRCRVKLSDGAERFFDLACNYSVGDKVSVIFANGKQIADVNSTTGGYVKDPIVTGPQEKFILPLVIGGCVLGLITVIFGIGILIIIATIVYAFKIRKEYSKQYRKFLFGDQ